MLNPIEKFKVAILHLNRDRNPFNGVPAVNWLNPIEKFKVAILHLNRDWNH